MRHQDTIGDIKRALASHPPGTFKLFRGTGTGAEENIETHLKNLEDVGRRIKRAIQAECYVEVISLRIQIVDYWLRIYFVNKAHTGMKRRREFGGLLDQCKELGFDNELYRELMAFNLHRINAIHGYVIGKIEYNILNSIVLESKSLSARTIIYVLQNCGEVITSFDGRFERGDMILNVPLQVYHLQNVGGI